MKIPYGRSNFADIRRGGFFYVDKTPFLPVLESGESGYAYLLFLRPRRFGKSLFLSLLEHYYDVAKADDFDALFEGLWIHQHPTPERNRYLVLSLDFSLVKTDAGFEALESTFLDAVRTRVLEFALAHESRLPAVRFLLDRMDRYQHAESLMSDLMTVVIAAGHQIYLLIDEYDHFANRLLAAGARDFYDRIVTGGFVRTFYASLKSGTGRGAIARIFVTGVTPLLLDDMASGFNIASQVSLDPALATMTGFTRTEVEGAIDLFLASHPKLAELAEVGDRDRLLAVLEQYYNGYRFSPGAVDRVFNSDMVLYFLSELHRADAYPADMLDVNVRTDYQRLLHIGVQSGGEAEQRRDLLETIAADGGIQSRIVRQFGVQGLASREQFLSFLYYLGMLTLGAAPPSVSSAGPGYHLEIPNRVIRDLQWEHLAILLADQGKIRIDTRDLDEPLRAMATGGDIAPFLALFHTRVVKALGIKDLRRFDEKSLKLMLLAFISLTGLFYPLSEKEFAQGYCDLFLGVSPLYPAAKFAWLLELKYLPSGAKPARIEAAFAEAAAQVARYASDERLVPLLTQGQSLKAGSLVFVGAQKVLFRPWPEPPPAPAPRAAKRAATPRKEPPSKPRKTARRTARR